MRAPDFWQAAGRRHPLALVLMPLGWAYGAAVRSRFRAARPWTSPLPVLCIGNLTAGGAGKTPVALDIGIRLQERGRAVHFLSRGYGGRLAGPLRVEADRHTAAEVGDEPLLLARTASAWIARDRPAGCRAIAGAGAQIIVMDDGFQNPALAKTLSLIVIDGEAGFGNGRPIPAGPLRESVAGGLARAHGVVVLGEDRSGVMALAKRHLPPGAPVLRAAIRPGPEADRLRGRTVVAFAGIGRPEKFFITLHGLGCRLVATHSFPDHHAYRETEIAPLIARAKAEDALAVTTAKDAVRLPPSFRDRVEVLTIGIEWENETALNAFLEPLHGTPGR